MDRAAWAHQHDRDVALSGSRAVAWLSDLGWVWTPSEDRSVDHFHVFADVIRVNEFAVGRIWHTAAALTLNEKSLASDNVFFALLAADGKRIITRDQAEREIIAGEMLVQRLNDPLILTSEVPCAHLFMISDWKRLALSGPVPSSPAADRDYTVAFSSAVNGVLNAASKLSSATFSHLRTGLEGLFASTIAASVAAHEPDSNRADPLRVRARMLIADHAAEPAFDVRKLAVHLGVSTSALYRAFDESGSAPAHEIREARVVNARALLARLPQPDDADLVSVAEAAGFGSVRTMQRSLARPR